MKKQLKNITTMQCVLTVLFVSSLLISNIITAKQVLLPFNITMTGAVFIFPITYILSDVFSEIYGYKWSRITCYMGFAMNLFMVTVFSLVIKSPAPEYWNNQEAFQIVLGNTPKVFGASLLAFIVGDLINDRVFRFFKNKHKDTKGFGFRAILSSIMGELVDSAIFLPIVFINQLPTSVLIQMMITQVSIKVVYEIIILPITYIIVNKLYKYENKEIKNNEN